MAARDRLDLLWNRVGFAYKTRNRPSTANDDERLPVLDLPKYAVHVRAEVRDRDPGIALHDVYLAAESKLRRDR